MNVKLPESREREIFLELLRHPNQESSDNTRTAVAERHGITLETLKAIERKGLTRDWPPLD
jgi:hypothetical protein